MTIRAVFAKETVSLLTAQGFPIVVRKGEHWPADDPVVQANPDLFTDDPRYGLSFSTPPPEMAEAPVEQATAAPGERRNTRRPVHG